MVAVTQAANKHVDGIPVSLAKLLQSFCGGLSGADHNGPMCRRHATLRPRAIGTVHVGVRAILREVNHRCNFVVGAEPAVPN